MTRYDPDKHHRRSIRLRGYDYARPGAYFVTICTQDRQCLFGEIRDGQMIVNDIGQMITHWWQELPRRFPSVTLDEFVVMPNHLHGILILHVGADRRVRPNSTVAPVKEGRHIGLPLHRIIQWFKTMTTNGYVREVKEEKWPPFNKRLWQRNYYEHVIRTEDEWDEIRAYIAENPLKWELDENHPRRLFLPETQEG
jgi:REP element-mobilizing transposase RayT